MYNSILVKEKVHKEEEVLYMGVNAFIRKYSNKYFDKK